MRRSEAAAPFIGAAVGAVIVYLSQTTTSEQMGDCPHVPCPGPAAGHATALGIALGLATGAVLAWVVVFAINRFIERSVNDR